MKDLIQKIQQRRKERLGPEEFYDKLNEKEASLQDFDYKNKLAELAAEIEQYPEGSEEEAEAIRRYEREKRFGRLDPRVEALQQLASLKGE